MIKSIIIELNILYNKCIQLQLIIQYILQYIMYECAII